jgi:hypothetical protein
MNGHPFGGRFPFALNIQTETLPIRRVTLKIRRGTERVQTIPSAGNASTSAKTRKSFSQLSAKNPHSL